MELAQLSIRDLQSLQGQIQREISRRERLEVQKAREQIQAIAHSVGLPLTELVGPNGRHKSVRGAIRFRHPENAGQQWTGRGRQPKWVKAWLENGKTLDSLRVS